MEWPPAPDQSDPASRPSSNYRDSYGWQAVGFLHPPESGEYKFFLAADDQSELWLSTDDNPANAKLIAKEQWSQGVRRYISWNNEARSKSYHLKRINVIISR